MNNKNKTNKQKMLFYVNISNNWYTKRYYLEQYHDDYIKYSVHYI